jgi:hypothetical protein
MLKLNLLYTMYRVADKSPHPQLTMCVVVPYET